MKDGDSDGIVPVTDSEEEAEKAREEFLAFARKKGVLLQGVFSLRGRGGG